MGDFGFLSKLLDKVQQHSTVVGKVWMSVLFLFRIMVLGAGVESVWGDERCNMECDTQRVGCTNVCYDWKFPVSHVRFWVMQIIFVSTPTLLYLGHAMHVISREKKLHENMKTAEETSGLKKPKYTDSRGRVQIKGVLLRSYMTQLFFKILLEVGFIVGQYYLYGFIMEHYFDCEMYPCIHKVQCFISRPTEKTLFIVFQLVVACISVLLSILEGFYLLCRHLKSKSRHNVHHQPLMAPAAVSPSWQPCMEKIALEAMNHNKTNTSYEGEKHL
ncbi:hypothetical protein ACEWY4_021736 [Coilia grayii]|uniref:Gap junction protein n=1 Tax=Coilia grayii TaxID=363190 RepID=A0ABD1J7J1_9TELE